jgi:Tfp pilus assembly protein PilO
MAISHEQLIAFVKKNPIGFGCGALCLALVVVMYYRADNVPAAEAELEQQSAEAERLASNLKNAAQLQEQLDTMLAAGKEVEARLVHPGDLAKNQQYFYKLEADTGTKIDCHQNPLPAEKDRKTTYLSVPYTVNVQGDYAQILSALRRLESGSHYCRVLSATLTAAAVAGTGEVTDSSLTLSLNLELLGQP